MNSLASNGESGIQLVLAPKKKKKKKKKKTHKKDKKIKKIKKNVKSEQKNY